MSTKKINTHVRIDNAYWATCRTRSGRITGYLEVFLDQNGNGYSIPGVSRWMRPESLARS